MRCPVITNYTSSDHQLGRNKRIYRVGKCKDFTTQGLRCCKCCTANEPMITEYSQTVGTGVVPTRGIRKS